MSRTTWQLIEGGHYSEAISAYTKLFNETGKVPYVNNRGIAHLLLYEYSKALEDFSLSLALDSPNFRSSAVLNFQAVCFWGLDRPTEAIQALREAYDAPYTDSGGGVIPAALLLYVAERLNDDDLRSQSMRLLRAKARRKAMNWPSAVAPFILGRLTDADLHACIDRLDNLILIDRERAQADFYSALKFLRSGDRKRFAEKITGCATNPRGILKEEFYFARWEVDRGFPEQVIRLDQPALSAELEKLS